MVFLKSIIRILSLLFIVYLPLSADVIVLKKIGDNLVAMDPKNTLDKENYMGSNGIFEIITKYQWPTNLLFAEEMVETERAELFAEADDAETSFINKKLLNKSCKARFVPNTVYQLCVIAYYAEQLQQTDAVADALKKFAQDMFDYFEHFFFNFDLEKNEAHVDLPATFKEFLDECKKPYSDPFVAEVSFLINCEIGRKIQDKGIPTTEVWKSIAADCINSILANQRNFDELPAVEPFSPEDRFDFTRFSQELDGMQLKERGILSNVIDAEIAANKSNHALIMNASKPFPQPIGIYTDGDPNRKVLTSSVVFSTLAGLAWDDESNQVKPHATSFGLYPLNGAFYCKYDMPYDYAYTEESYFQAGSYFYGLKINKGDYYNNRCDNLFIIPPFSPLTQLFGLDSMYHALTTVAFKTVPSEPTEIHGFEIVHDPASILLIQDDPIKHAQRLAAFAAQHAILLKVPQNATWEDGLQLLENFNLASKFYETFTNVSAAQKQYLNNATFESLSREEQIKIVQGALVYYLTLAKEPQYLSSKFFSIFMFRILKNRFGKEFPHDFSKYIQAIEDKIYDNYIHGLTFARDAWPLLPKKIESFFKDIQEFNGLVTKNKWDEINNVEKQVRAQMMESTSLIPAASIWLDIAAGANLSATDKKTSFITDCQELAGENAKINAHPHDASTLRIATYNVHFWKDPHENWSTTLGTIAAIDADVLILQEVEFFNTEQYEEYKNLFKQQGFLYGTDVFGNTEDPSSGILFGNMILSKHPLESEPIITSFSTNYDQITTRCFINAKIKLPNGEVLSMYGTHLDVFDGTEAIRLEQIKELIAVVNADPSDHVLIAGDLNSVRQQDYMKPPSFWNLVVAENAKRGVPTPTLVLDHLQNNGFVDCFTKIGKPGPRFTTWAGTTIDFILLRNGWQLPINDCAVYFDAASDHIPVLMDVNLQKSATKPAVSQLETSLLLLQQKLELLKTQIESLKDNLFRLS